LVARPRFGLPIFLPNGGREGENRRNSRFVGKKRESPVYSAIRLYETTSEESYCAAGMAYRVSNLNLLDGTNTSSSFSSSSVSGNGGAGIDLGIFTIGGSASAGSSEGNLTTSRIVRRRCAEERGQQCPRGSSWKALARHDLFLEADQALNDRGGDAEVVEEAVANLGP
jgi:hypothetical protein